MTQRVQHPTAVAVKPAATYTGTVGYYNNDPGTWVTAENMNQLQEAIVRTIEYANITPVNSDDDQLRKAVQKLQGEQVNRIANRVRYTTGAVATTTTLIPNDNTVPQNTEGSEFMYVSYTPRSASSTLIVEVYAFAASSVAAGLTAALFKDSDTDAMATAYATVAAAAVENLVINHSITAGTTSPITFRVRIGASAAGTVTFNGFGGNGILGGTLCSRIVVTELLPYSM